ncbi:cytochrome c oxidase subunit 4, mitochondrial [Diutina catenulata]
MLARTFRVSRQIPVARVFARNASQKLMNQPTAEDLAQVTGPDSSLIGKGATPGTIPTDKDQATGLERFELLGKAEGIDVFDSENPIDQGSGTPQDPFLVPTYMGYRYVGCQGKAGEEAHKPYWMKVEEGEENARCWQCGNVFKALYLGEPGQQHH